MRSIICAQVIPAVKSDPRVLVRKYCAGNTFESIAPLAIARETVLLRINIDGEQSS